MMAKQLKKIPVVSGVCDGFIGNRILTRYRQAADSLLAEGASPQEVDAAMRAFGMAMGPYKAQDMSGLDIAYANRRRQDVRHRPGIRYVPLVEQLVEDHRRLGRKSGAGWYDYDASGAASPSAVVAACIAGVSHAAGIGPVPATLKLLARQGVKIEDLGLIELNEAFASQALACLRGLNIADNDPRVNPNGGAIALGHPLGMSGGVEAIWALPLNADTSRVILYTHGGGFAVGSADSHRKLAGHLAKSLGVTAAVLHYRRAPEHPFPAQIDDAVAAYQALLAEGYDARKITTAGDSAGGNLAIASVLKFRDLGEAADRFDLRRSYQFNTKVVAARFDEDTNLWLGTTDKGQILHTGAWPEGIDLSGKKVGVIGTGSTGIQVIMALAPAVKNLTVFQRSAQYVVPIGNWSESEAKINEYKANYDAIWKQVKESVVAFGFKESTIPYDSISEAERQSIFERIWHLGGGFRFMFETFSDIATNPQANEAACNFIKGKIKQIVKDPETARKLMPTDIYAKRPLCGIDYYGVYNRDNVNLVDLKNDAISELITAGVRLQSGEEHELDVLVLATGFDAVEGNYTKIDIRGRNGLTLREKWKDGPLGYLGMMEADFPNLFMILGPIGPFTNLPPSIETQVEWFSDLIADAERKGVQSIEATQSAADEWVQLCETIANMTLFPKADSWIFGAKIPGKKNTVRFYMAGLGAYRNAIQKVKDSGY